MKNRVWLIVLLMAALFTVIILGGYVVQNRINLLNNAGRRFERDKEVTATRAFDRIMSMDPDVNYPSSPEGVMDFFNEAHHFMYSRSIIDDGTLFEVMARQREVYSEELRILNPVELQFSQLKNELELLYADNSICLSIERKGTVYDDNFPGECVVQTMTFYNTFGAVYRNYFLIQDESGKWRVNGWRTTDEHFTIVATSPSSSNAPYGEIEP